MQESSSDGTGSESGWPSAEGVLVAAGSSAQATEGESGEAPAAGPAAGINLAVPSQEEMQDRETRAGQSGSASEANNEATPADDTTGNAAAPLHSANPFIEEGNALSGGTPANVRRDENYQPNTPGNSAPANYADGGTTNGWAGGTMPPPQPQPAVQDGNSNTVIIAEGGSELNPDVTGKKENTPGTNGASTQPASAAAPGYDEQGNPLPGADGRVSMDDWVRLNDRDGDGQVDRNYVDLSGAEDTNGGGEPTGAPAGAVGDGIPVRSADVGGTELEERIPGGAAIETGAIGESIPVPSAEMGGVALEDRIPGGGATDTGGTAPLFGGRPGLDDLRPGLRGRIPDLAYEQDGTGLPPGLERPNGPGTFPPGVGELLDQDGDGRPDTRLPGTELPTFDPPVRGPGLTIPEDLGPVEPGPEFEPGVDIAPPPPEGGLRTPPDVGHPPGNGNGYPPPVADLPHSNGNESPAPIGEHPPGDGNGSAYPPPVTEPPAGLHAENEPSNPGPFPAGNGPAADEPPTAVDVVEGTSASNAGASLDVFLTPPGGSKPSSIETGMFEPAEVSAVSEPAVVSGWTLTASPALARFDAESDRALGASSIEPGLDPAAVSPELAALIASVRAAADAATAPFRASWRRDPDDPNVLERLIEMVREALFIGDSQPSDDEILGQIASLDPAALSELERYAREQLASGLVHSEDELEDGG